MEYLSFSVCLISLSIIPSRFIHFVTHGIYIPSKLLGEVDTTGVGTTLKVLGLGAISWILCMHYFANKGPSSQGYGFSCGHVWMWELDCEEGWVPKDWCFWTVVLEKTLESPLDCKEIQPAHSEGDQPWDFFGRNDAKAETPILWPPHAKCWLIGKDSDAGRAWGQEEKGTTGAEVAGWHYWLNGRESEWTPGVGDRQGGLACYDSWGRKESDMAERLNWTELINILWGEDS